MRGNIPAHNVYRSTRRATKLRVIRLGQRRVRPGFRLGALQSKLEVQDALNPKP